ncbi:MAG: hypothetical protein ACRYGF_16705 [Janthinobacterium lividum]
MTGFIREGWGIMRSALETNTPMRISFWWQCMLLAATLVALPFDRRTILGLSPWIKPLKFEVSAIIYLLTITLMLHGVRWHRSPDGAGWFKSRRRLSWSFAVSMTIEITLIALQSARGVRSHMNYSSPLNGLIFAVMGQLILLNTVAAAWLLWMWCAGEVRTPAAVTWGVRLGLFMLLAGSLEGVSMVTHGGHTVGAEDGLAGLPFVNWSRGHGDLRVAHFFALHALQLMPLTGLLLSRTSLRRLAQVACLFVFAALYVGGVWWLFAQAMQGRPVLPG